MLPHGVHVVPIGEWADEDVLDELGIDLWATTDRADMLFDRAEIRFSSYEEVRYGAVYGEDVVGAATLGMNRDGNGGCEFTFSVVVDDEWQRQGIARYLVNTVMADASGEALSCEYAMFRVWVVDPRMALLLEDLGFESDGIEWTLDSPHMSRPMIQS
ncbi:MAG: hypothetical protein DRH30_04855 [Deltaproteobacteria bacterium]|nr:MAG: hypothetical protein DRH30_04855 [Deltaproteobacteria bacterium]